MKVTVTYRTSKQIAEDGWAIFTEVIHLENGWTLEQVYEIVAQKISPRATKDFNINAEIQFIF